MKPLYLKYLFITIVLGIISVAKAQQPFLKYKPYPPRVDSFDVILSIPPFKVVSLRLSLAMEMRLNKNYTLKLTPSIMNTIDPNFITVQNLEVTDFSSLEHFNEQCLTAMIKRYKGKNNSRVYFGPYLGFGMEARRTNIKMGVQIPNFEKAEFSFSTQRKSLVFAIGTTKLFSKRIIFDCYAAIKYQYKITNKGNFDISGPGYNQKFGGTFGFTIGMPINRRKI